MKSIKIYAHVSATPEQFAQKLGGEVSSTVDPECDVAIFAINPGAGIDNDTIDLWRQFDEYQTPRMVLVTVLEGMEMDFDDAVLVANRVFDQLVTPYLVLHSDSGDPTALIDLQSLEIIDYSTIPTTRRDSDSEHKELVADFREEFLESVEDAGEDAFEAGLLFPAIPVVITKGIGIDIVKSFIERVVKN